MTDQRSLFPNTEERTVVSTSKEKRTEAKRPVLREGDVPKAWQAMMVSEMEGTGCLICRGFIPGEGGPPTEDLIEKYVSDLGWTLEGIRAMDSYSTYPFFVYVVCDGSSR